MYFISGFLLIVLILIISHSCRKHICDDPCDARCQNFDPCCGQSPPDASFTIYEDLSWYVGSFSDTMLSPTDTITTINNPVLLRANHDASYYEWKIGSDDRVWNTRDVRLNFASLPLYTPLLITLKVYKPVNRSCFPEAEDTVTSTRTLVKVPRDSAYIFNKGFVGYTKNQPNVERFFKYEIGEFDEIHQFTWDTLYAILPGCTLINGFKPDTLSDGLLPIRFGYKSFRLGGAYAQKCCLGINLFGYILPNDSIYVKMNYFERSSIDTCKIQSLTNKIRDEFYGKRVY